jgi:SAM-dependent methyltransferase
MDDSYTQQDHDNREDDAYAIAKYRWTLRKLRRKKASGHLLNVGCGTGLFNELAVECGYNVTAIEPDPAAYEIAAEKIGNRARVLNCGVQEFNSDRVFEVVVIHDVLEHIEDDRGAAINLANFLHNDGVLVGSVPALQALFGLHDEQLGHYRRYSKREIRRVLETQFASVSCRYFGFSAIPFVWYHSKFRRQSYPMYGGESRGFLQMVFRGVCRLEEVCPSPIGSSILFVARKKQ